MRKVLVFSLTNAEKFYIIRTKNHKECVRDCPDDRTATCVCKVLTAGRWVKKDGKLIVRDEFFVMEKNMWKVCKFGGTSLACAENARRCVAIVQADETRRFVVASAPGKRNKDAKKVTDFLAECHAKRFDKQAFDECFAVVKATYEEMATLAEDFPIAQELELIYQQIRFSESNIDFVLSRGEYLNAKILAKALGFVFLDATEFVRFRAGELDLKATLAQAEKIDKTKRYVIPGFYGLNEKGYVKTFSRGGSDITGSIVARAFGCDLYENWTDVDGICICDPKVVKDSKKVEQVSFRELREMSYMGASVLHAETLLPVYDTPIPIVLKNSFHPDAAGTEILKKRTRVDEKETITCITGKNDYTCIQISKMLLDKQLGFVKKVTSVFEEYHINISHTHSGLDNLCLFVEKAEYQEISFSDFLKELENRIDADKIKGHENLALVAVIGHNLSGKIGVLSSVFNALKRNKISVKTIYQSISECNLILGIEDGQLKSCVRALYQELIGETV